MSVYDFFHFIFKIIFPIFPLLLQTYNPLLREKNKIILKKKREQNIDGVVSIIQIKIWF